MLAVVLLVQERPPATAPAPAPEDRAPRQGLSLHGSTAAVVDVARKLRDAMLQPSIRPLLLLLATYKLGEALSDTMFKPFLLDRGVTAGEIARVSGQGSMLASILGSLLGGTPAAGQRWRSAGAGHGCWQGVTSRVSFL